jgi:hypothetical protein
MAGMNGSGELLGELPSCPNQTADKQDYTRGNPRWAHGQPAADSELHLPQQQHRPAWCASGWPTRAFSVLPPGVSRPGLHRRSPDCLVRSARRANGVARDSACRSRELSQSARSVSA